MLLKKIYLGYEKKERIVNHDMDPEQKYCIVYKHKDKHHQVTISCDWHQFFVLQTCALEGRIRRIYLLSTHLALLNRLTIEPS